MKLRGKATKGNDMIEHNVDLAQYLNEVLSAPAYVTLYIDPDSPNLGRISTNLANASDVRKILCIGLLELSGDNCELDQQ